MNTEDKDTVIRNGIWFAGRRHLADGFTDISSYILCTVYYHWRHIILKCHDMDR